MFDILLASSLPSDLDYIEIGQRNEHHRRRAGAEKESHASMEKTDH